MNMSTRLIIALTFLITLGITAAHADDAGVAPAAADSPTTGHPYRDAGLAPADEKNAAPLPNPAEAPQASASLLFKLYKAGHLVPMIVVASFFLLLLLQRWIAWLRTGYRKLVVSSALAALAMLAERAAEGTTPNLNMLAGALGVALAMWLKTEGEPKAEKA